MVRVLPDGAGVCQSAVLPGDPMKIVVFGLSVSSSWGNGHATLWRGLLGGLGALGHQVVFFERDAPYYAAHRDLTELANGHRLRLYDTWAGIANEAGRELAGADAALVTSYCPDGPLASELVLDSPARVRVFYDLDTPVTLARLEQGEPVEYLPPDGLHGFDLVLSFTGGLALEELRERLGARQVAPLYGSVDPAVHKPVASNPEYSADLSYLGTYADDRQAVLERLFLEPARRRPAMRFLLGGSLYPPGFGWTPNLYYVRHVAPQEHAALHCSSRLTLNITRAAMAAMGYCPSGRLFEAAACGAPILTDSWAGLDEFFEPGIELLVASTTDDVLAALDLPETDLARIGAAARERALGCHTARHRAAELVRLLDSAATRSGPTDRPAITVA
jgi:spore maturation protein CgeB